MHTAVDFHTFLRDALRCNVTFRTLLEDIVQRWLAEVRSRGTVHTNHISLGSTRNECIRKNKWADKKSASAAQCLLGYLVANGKVCLFQTDLTQTSSPPTPGMLRPYAESSATSQQTSISNVIPFYQFYFVFMPREAGICGICPKKAHTRTRGSRGRRKHTEIKDKGIQRLCSLEWEVCQECFGYTSWLKLAHWTTEPWNYNTGDWGRTFCRGGIIFLYSVMTKKK